MPSETVTPQPPVDPAQYAQIATGVIAEIAKMSTTIPYLEPGLPPSMVKFVRGHLNVPNEFVATAAATVDQNSSLQGLNRFDTAATKEILRYIEAFQPVASRFYAIGDALAYTIWTKKASAAAAAFRIYAIAKQLALIDGDATAQTHVADMKQALGRTNRKKKVDAPQPQPSGTHS